MSRDDMAFLGNPPKKKKVSLAPIPEPKGYYTEKYKFNPNQEPEENE